MESSSPSSSSNWSAAMNDSTAFVPYSERLETYIVPIVFAIIFIVGVLGNGTLILIFLRHSNMRNVPNTYIFSLAVGDLIVMISCLPFTAIAYTFDSYPFGELICKVSEGVKDLSIGVSVFTLTALSADRFFAIVDPMRTLHTGGGRATRLTIITALSIWAFAILCAVPSFLFSRLRNFPDDEHVEFTACFPYPVMWPDVYPKASVFSRFFVYYAIPLCIIGCFYVLMARHLIQSTRNIPGEMHGQVRQVRARRKVAKMVLAFVILFAICFFPHHVFMIWFNTNPNSNADYNAFWHAFRIIAFCLSYLNSCINPIALYCVSGAFRKHFNRYLLCSCCQAAESGNRGRGVAGEDASKRAASRRCTSKSTWDSTTMAQFQNLSLRRNPQVLLQPHEDATVTTLLNGGHGVGVGGDVDAHHKKVELRIMSFN